MQSFESARDFGVAQRFRFHSRIGVAFIATFACATTADETLPGGLRGTETSCIAAGFCAAQPCTERKDGAPSGFFVLAVFVSDFIVNPIRGDFSFAPPGLVSLDCPLPTACAVGCILSLLRSLVPGAIFIPDPLSNERGSGILPRAAAGASSGYGSRVWWTISSW